MEPDRRTPWVHSPLFWIVLVGGLLRLYDLTARSLWFDEAVSILIAQDGLAGAVRAADAEKLPPLYNVLLWLFLRVFRGEAAARILSVVLATATIPLVSRIGERLVGRAAGLVAAALLAASPFHLWYAQEIRMYALQTLLAAGSCLAMLRLLETPTRRRAAAYAVWTALMLYAQYTSLFVVAFQNLFFVLFWKRHRATLRMWLLAQLLAGLLFAPWLPFFVSHLLSRSGEFWLPELSARYLLSHFLNFTGGLQSRTPLNEVFSWAGLGLLAVGGTVVLASKQDRYAGTFLLAWFLVPTLLLILFSLRTNIFLSRSLLITLPAFVLLVAAAAGVLMRVHRLPARTLAVLVLAALFAAYGYGIFHYFADPNWWLRPPHREMAWRIARLCAADDLVVHVSRFTYRPYQFYVKDHCRMGLLRETEELPALFDVIGRSDLPADAAGIRRIWFVAYEDFQMRGLSRQAVAWMKQHHQEKQVLFSDRLNYIALFERKADAAWPTVLRRGDAAGR